MRAHLPDPIDVFHDGTMEQRPDIKALLRPRPEGDPCTTSS